MYRNDNNIDDDENNNAKDLTCLFMFFVFRTKLQSNMAACQNDILKLSTELLNCVRKNDIIGAKRLFFNITEKKDRKLIVAKREDCNAPLFEAALKGNAAMMSFLVKECYADLEERGKYFVYKLTPRASIFTKSNDLVTPLWYAAASNKLEVVKCLIDLGADINTVFIQRQYASVICL